MVFEEIRLLLPYLTLAIFIAGLSVIPSRIVLSILLFSQILFTYFYGIISPIGLGAVAVFWGLCAFHWRNLSPREWVNAVRVLLIAILAIGFASHLIPGFHNLRVFSGLQLSSTAIPYTMYLNFDKSIAAFIIAITSGFFIVQEPPLTLKSLRDIGIISVLALSLLIPLALLTGLVGYDPKFPNAFWLWAFNNLYFVCFAEEVIFRGLIQTQLMKLGQQWKLSPYVSIIITSILFAVSLPGHLQGGPVYIAFVTLAGLFYGYAYYYTKRLEAAIFVHFIVNVSHFLLFSYPLAAAYVK